MKTAKNVYTKIIDKNNIYEAILNASKGKKKRDNVIKILDDIDFYVEEVYLKLVNKKYIPKPYVAMKIHDGVRKKERIIYKPAFYPDQIVHWALMQQIEPFIMRGMYDYCCGSVKNRGILYAMKYIKRILVQNRKNTKYCLKLDIKKFYPSINKNILKKKFLNIIRDNDTLELINIIIDSSNTGVPIGNYTSQWFANFFLQDLDHYIKEDLKVPFYLRYMDDMVIFHRNKKELHKIKDKIEAYLKAEDLTLKENWQLFKTDSRPLDFLGYRFYRGYTTLRKSNFLRIKRRYKKISKKPKITYQDASASLSYYGWLKHCNSYNFNQKYVKPYVDLKKCKGVIQFESRKQLNT